MLHLVILIGLLAAGCPRVISLDYVPSNKERGEGRLHVESFHYREPEKGLDRPKEMEADSQEFEVFYLSQDIGAFFTQALKKELAHSGYTLADGAKVVVSGEVEHFRFDYERPEGQTFEIQVSYKVKHGEAMAYSYTCESTQQRSTALTTSGLVIKAGIKDCIERFIRAAQDAKAL
ncbi:MAG TPA: hypothetical protein VHF07_07840 [Nitrospiraceae bacterium]|nr:hypothetical protein [Nitrospiraceae bacterium]